ncbi:DUF3850 domain-containing protein [Streptomyces sp. TRM76323]|uniref:DUF3850 domain-containing protein n=1 Tax=Streptomyces tamarix TaxID=3078565 RepID=A0ABU3QKP5_9ACTN|nr:DUF3850 domain-containing protein [Streptomyces tamarix]MDT9683339.1 DUF3850 domain-containing protein [Streptomyces tamarix]
MKIHELKLDSKFWNDVRSGIKTFEIRKNDRKFKVGDVIALTMYSGTFSSYASPTVNGHDYVSQSEAPTMFYDITYITDYEQKEGYVVMSIIPSSQVENIKGQF